MILSVCLLSAPVCSRFFASFTRSQLDCEQSDIKMIIVSEKLSPSPRSGESAFRATTELLLDVIKELKIKLFHKQH